MSKYIIATIKSWNIRNALKLQKAFPEHDFILITEKEKLDYEMIKEIQPELLFFPHWSWKIPKMVYENYKCVVFHMTDLPFGRGGSPLQNLIARGIYDTRISALEAAEEMDAGRIYLKVSVNISSGNADEMLSKISDIVFGNMIPRFFENVPALKEQQGEVVAFKRRTKQQSRIPEGLSARQIYDYIRMLDGEGYPPAYIEYGNGKIFYWNAELKDGVVYVQAEFRSDDE